MWLQLEVNSFIRLGPEWLHDCDASPFFYSILLEVKVLG
jgi:hypothetical protein